MPAYFCPLYIERESDGFYSLSYRGQNCGSCIHWSEGQCIHEDAFKTITDVKRGHIEEVET